MAAPVQDAAPVAKRQRLNGAAVVEDDFDALGGGGDDIFDALDELDFEPPKDPPEEVARRDFVERLARKAEGGLTESDLGELVSVLLTDATHWGEVQHWRSAALLLVYVARASRAVRITFAAEHMPVLGNVLLHSVAALESGDAAARQEAGMQALACLACLRALPIGRATMWEHRQTVGKAFDRLHRWCGKERSALAAELRAPTDVLCKKWRRQPRPAMQDASAEHKALRMKVVDMITQGLMGIAGNSPASPAVVAASPGRLPPSTMAAEIEAALYGQHGSVSADYRQHARMLRSNLACHSNSALRERVLSGEMSPEELVKMDSDMLAPDALREQRHEQQEKAFRATVVQELVPITRLMSNSEDRAAYNPNMAPPILVSPTHREREVEEVKPAPPPPTVAPMVPPPTPFRMDAHDLAAASGTMRPPNPLTPEVMATPHPDDEDEEHAALVRFLSSRPI